MKRGLTLLAAALFALAGTAAVRASSVTTLAVNDQAIEGDGMPRLLSDYRFFTDLRGQQPIPQVLAYRLNTPLYSDGAEKLRFVYVPKGAQIGADKGGGLLQFPVGSALIKTFAFGEGAARRLIETRVLLHRTDGWVALPYRWNAEQTEAQLVIAGARLPVTTPAGEQISYRIPNKNQCKECHSLNDAVVPIGPKARNMSAAWLGDLSQAGLLDHVRDADVLPRWEARDSSPVSVAARAYLDVNCAHCHRPGAAASNSGLDLRWEQTDLTKLGIGKRPVAAGRGSGGLEFDIKPGKPDQSIVAHRMGSTEPGVAMPELGKSTVDRDGLAIIERWIAQMETQ